MEKIKCADCGELVDESNIFTTHDGRKICNDCYEQNYFTCNDCGQIFPNEDGVWIEDDEAMVCYDCAVQDYSHCEDCGLWYSPNSMRFRSGNYNADRNICSTCGDNWSQCRQCGTVLQTDEMYYDEEDGEYYCSDCHDRRSSQLHDYGYKPAPKFYKNSGEHNHLYFGVELETDYGDDEREYISDLTNTAEDMIYCKHDGSLDDGVEIVTHPMTLAFHENKMPWGDLVQIAKDHGYKSHCTSTCGLHVHVGRKQMGEDDNQRSRTAANLVLLTDLLWQYIVPFTRRKTSGLSQWARRPDLGLSANVPDSTLINWAMDTERNGRYQAVNLTNRTTVEFRIFRGTLHLETLLASIQLVSNMTKYAMTHTPTDCAYNATWDDIIHIEEHAELTAYSEKCAKDIKDEECASEGERSEDYID